MINQDSSKNLKHSRRGTLLKEKTYTTFDGRISLKSLPELCLDLLSEQKKEWLDLRKGYELLKEVKERDLSYRRSSIRLQFNPMRIKNTTANVSKKNLKERRCILCLNHLPKCQKGIFYRSNYFILCNPMPVFSSHFTVSHLDHRRQAIDEHIDTFLQLMADFGSDWVILYNGPKCGASAPDHLHFQAVPSGQIPIEKEIRGKKRLALVKQVDGVLFYHVRDLGREIITLLGDDSAAVGDTFKRLLNALKKVLLVNEEPMINIIGFYEDRKWCLLIFPRRKHRPDAFFRKGNDRLVVSPGVIDMAGVLITPVEKDFGRLDEAAVEGIYREVSLKGETVKRAIDTMLPKD